MTPIQPYKVALTQSDDQFTAASAEAQAKEMEMSVTLAQANLEVELVRGQNEMAIMCRQYPLQLEKILLKMNELAHLRRRIRLIEELLKTLFPMSTS